MSATSRLGPTSDPEKTPSGRSCHEDCRGCSELPTRKRPISFPISPQSQDGAAHRKSSKACPTEPSREHANQAVAYPVADRIRLGAAAPVKPWQPQRLENGELVDESPEWWPRGKPKYRGVVKKRERRWRADVLLGSRGEQVPAGHYETEYEAALAVVAKSREMQDRLPWTIPDNVATLPNWIVLTYTCPSCATVMQTDPLEGMRACSLHTRECRKVQGRGNLDRNYDGDDDSHRAVESSGSSAFAEAPRGRRGSQPNVRR